MRQQIITQLRQYFKVQELVCPHTYLRFGDDSWFILSTDFLHTLLVLRRDILKVPLIANTYLWDKNYDTYIRTKDSSVLPTGIATQRGHRCNLCALVQERTAAGQNYLSAHMLGKGGDFISNHMTAYTMRDKIKRNKTLLPVNTRIEKDVTWLHADTYDWGTKLYEF